MGDNIFIAEFSLKQDVDRVLDGSPWHVDRKAVLVQHFDPNLRPSEVTKWPYGLEFTISLLVS